MAQPKNCRYSTPQLKEEKQMYRFCKVKRWHQNCFTLSRSWIYIDIILHFVFSLQFDIDSLWYNLNMSLCYSLFRWQSYTDFVQINFWTVSRFFEIIRGLVKNFIYGLWWKNGALVGLTCMNTHHYKWLSYTLLYKMASKTCKISRL